MFILVIYRNISKHKLKTRIKMLCSTRKEMNNSRIKQTNTQSAVKMINDQLKENIIYLSSPLTRNITKSS